MCHYIVQEYFFLTSRVKQDLTLIIKSLTCSGAFVRHAPLVVQSNFIIEWLEIFKKNDIIPGGGNNITII